MATPRKDPSAPVRKNITDRACIAALRRHGAIISPAASEVGISRQALWERVQKSKKLQAVCKEVAEELLDTGEGHVVTGVKSGDKFYVDMYLRQKGKKRGYGTQVQTSFDDAQVEAIVAALGGKPEAYRAALAQLGVDPDQA